MPGSAVFVISSIFGKSGRRSATFLRIAASSAKAAGSRQPARTRAARWRKVGVMCASRVEGPCREPALERLESIDESHAIVAEFANGRRLLRKQTLQSVGNAQHGPGGRGALPYVPPKQPFVAEAAPGLAMRDDVDQRGDVGETKIEALTGERVNDVRCIAEQHPAGAAQGRRPAEHERPCGAIGGGQRQRSSLAASVITASSPTRCSHAENSSAAPAPSPCTSMSRTGVLASAASASQTFRWRSNDTDAALSA